MAGTALNYDSTQIQAGSPGQLWTGLTVPAAAARITLDADGTPDATEHPNAVHLGMTREGSTLAITPTFESFFADEFAAPLKSRMTAVEMSISCELLQTVDITTLQKIMQGWGTYATGGASTWDEIRVGQAAAMTYESVALIFPLEADPTKFGVFNLYQAFVEGGLSAYQVSRKIMSGAAVTFKGTAITTRAATDTVGNYWKQT